MCAENWLAGMIACDHAFQCELQTNWSMIRPPLGSVDVLCIQIGYQEGVWQTSHPNFLPDGVMEPGLQADRLLERPLLC
jgi:hypothetical protein